MRSGVLAFVLGCSAATQQSSTDAGPPDAAAPKPDAPATTDPFVEATPYEPDGPLCDIPPGYVPNGGNPHDPPCMIAVGNYRDNVPAKPYLRVVAWNVEFGNDTAAILDALTTRPALANADILLLSEVPRRSLTSNPDNVDLARQIAMQLHRSYAFAVEWDRRELPTELGEHGVAVISRYPIANPRMLRHHQLNDWYGESHLYGGRVSVGVDIDVGGHVISAYASHFDTRGTGDSGRALQAAELRADATAPGRPAIVVDGGDFNTWTCNPLVSDCTVAPAAEQTIRDFNASWSSGTGSWNGVTQYGKGFFPQHLDWVFYRGPGAMTGQADSATGSDHLPVYFDLEVP